MEEVGKTGLQQMTRRRGRNRGGGKVDGHLLHTRPPPTFQPWLRLCPVGDVKQALNNWTWDISLICCVC